MKLQALLIIGLLGLSGSVWAQACPNGIPAASNPGCIPPNNPMSPYYQGQQQPQQPQQQLPPQPTGYWEKTWGAIAPSPVGGVVGAAVGASSKEEAEHHALEDCRAKGGGACEVEIAYHNQCAVMVIGQVNYRFASAASIPEASELGIKLCKERGDSNCRIYYSACTEPIFHEF
jgi:hypothetical protein